ncbi:MAG: hypothetical protein ACK4NR_02060 [Micavibrio sp.]
MVNTSKAPLWIVILRNVMISAVAGALFGCLLFPSFGAILQAAQNDNYALLNFPALLKKTFMSPLLVLYILPFLLPLIGIACLVGILFQGSIQKHLEFWCFIAPLSVWLAAIFILIQTPPNQYYEQFTTLERFLIEISNPEHFLFLIASAFSSFIFYRLSKSGFKW